MVADDNLDVTASSGVLDKVSEVASIPAANKEDFTKSKIPGLAFSSSSAIDSKGLSIMQKFLFVSSVVGICVLFLRTRVRSENILGNFKEKSLA